MSTVSSTPRGQLLGQYCQAILLAKGDPMAAHAFAQGQGSNWAQTALHLKGAVAALSTDNSGELSYPVQSDFAEMLRPLTIIGRLQGLRRVPFNCKMISNVTGASAAWIGVGIPIPLSALDFDRGANLEWCKVASLVAVTTELIRSSAPAVATVLANDIARAAAYVADLAFLDPENGGSAGVKPASVLFGADSIPSIGSSVAQIDADLRGALAILNNAAVGLDTATWIMAPHTAVFLSTVRGSGGAAAYPLVTAKGGVLMGLPVLTSGAIIQDANSPTETYIALVAASEISVADDGESVIDVSTHAAIQMDGAPSAGAAQLVDLWSHGLAGLKATRTINWALRRPDAVACISGVTY